MPRESDHEMRSAAEQLLALGHKGERVGELLRLAAEGHREVVDAYPHLRKVRGRVPPTVRTIQRWAIPLKPVRPDAPDRWTILDADPEDAKLVLGMISELGLASRGNRAFVTKDEARLLVTLFRCAPGLNSVNVWPLVQTYIHRLDKGAPTSDLDILLASQPWASVENRMRYFRNLRDGVVELPSLAPGWKGSGLVLIFGTSDGLGVGFEMSPSEGSSARTLYEYWDYSEFRVRLPSLLRDLDIVHPEEFDQTLRSRMIKRQIVISTVEDLEEWDRQSYIPGVPKNDDEDKVDKAKMIDPVREPVGRYEEEEDE